MKLLEITEGRLGSRAIPTWEQFVSYHFDPGEKPTFYSAGEAYEMLGKEFKTAKSYFNYLINYFNKLPDPVPLNRTLNFGQNVHFGASKSTINRRNKKNEAIKKQAIDNILKGKWGLGNHWSTEVIMTKRDSNIVLQANAPKKSIDWKETMSYRFGFPYESEIYVSGFVYLTKILSANKEIIWEGKVKLKTDTEQSNFSQATGVPILDI